MSHDIGDNGSSLDHAKLRGIKGPSGHHRHHPREAHRRRGRRRLRRLAGPGSTSSWPATAPRARPPSSRGHGDRRTSPSATATSDRRAGPASCASSSREAGLDAGADTIGWHLTPPPPDHAVPGHDQPDPDPGRRGDPEPSKRPKSSYIRFEADACPTRPGSPTSPTTGSPTPTAGPAPTSRSSPGSTTTPATPCTCSAHARVTAPIVLITFRQAADLHGYPASTLTDNGMVYTVRLAGHGRQGGRNAFEAELRRLRHRPEELPTQPPHHLRQGRTIPADHEEVATRPTNPAHARSPSSRPSSTPSSTSTTTGDRTARCPTAPPPPPPTTPARRPPPATDRSTDTHDRVRHDNDRQRRHRHPARRRPTAPHRRRPNLRPNPRHPARPGPPRPRRQRRHRRTPPRAHHRPTPRLPAHRQTTRTHQKEIARTYET